MIDEGQTSPAPDILLYDHAQEKTMVLIEITHTSGVKKDCDKILGLMNGYDVPQGFVYDYKKQVWYRFTKDNPKGENSSICDIIKTDLNGFLLKKKPF